MTTYTIDQRTPAYKEQLELIRLPRTLLGGTRAMREANTTYLPKKGAETSGDYQDRLNGAVLVNYFVKTIDYLAGQVFQKPVDYQPIDNPQYDQAFFDAFKEDVDLAGNNLSAFSLDLFKDGITDGLVFLLVDHNTVRMERDELTGLLFYELPDGSLAPKTRAADQANGWRPYFVKVPAGQVLDALITMGNGEKKLIHFRFEEAFERAAGDDVLTRETVTRIRAYWPGRWETWEKAEGDSSPRLIDQGRTGLDFIPVYWFMPGEDRQIGITAVPPMADLAETNRAHWVSYSSHINLMKWVRSPVWLGVGLTGADNKPLEFGPSRFLSATAATGGTGPDLKSVGVDPASVDKSMLDLKKMEDYMEAYGLQLALNPAGYTTATQVATVANASDSQLKGWCVLLQDCLENALKAVSEYLDGQDGPAVSINTSFRQEFDANKATFLKSNRDSGNLSLPTYLNEIQKMGAISDEIDLADEVQRIEEEQAAAMPSLGNFNMPSDEGE